MNKLNVGDKVKVIPGVTFMNSYRDTDMYRNLVANDFIFYIDHIGPNYPEGYITIVDFYKKNYWHISEKYFKVMSMMMEYDLPEGLFQI